MAYDDDDFGRLFPTRFGTPSGTANERTMLDNLGGSKSFRTKIRETQQGVTTTLRTNNGMPRFTTEEEAKSLPEPKVPTAYMETGQLEWSYPGEENPDRLKHAIWKLRDVPPQGDWVGLVTCSTANIGDQEAVQPTPIDTRVIRDSINSRAIGYPETLDAYQTLQNEELYGPATITKKLICAYFPTTHFSGKLRRFMQAQYGAMETLDDFGFSLDIVGATATLHYTRPDIPGSPTVQFGFWSHYTTGLFSAADYNYYLVNVTHGGGGGTNVALTGYPIKYTNAGNRILNKLRSGTLPIDEVRKAETYLFSQATIETDKVFTIGSYDPGTCGGSAGGSLAWGWKFNQSGTKASIVLANIVGEELLNTLDGRTKEVTLNISRSSVFDGSETGKWTLTGVSSSEYSWTDGWGNYNIFVPEDQHSNVLSLYSIKLGFNSVADYPFSSVPIYGFYDKNDEWESVKITRHATNDAVYYEQNESGFVFDSSYLAAYDSTAFHDGGGHAWDVDYDSHYLKSNAGASYEFRSVGTNLEVKMDVSVNGWTYNGIRKQGEYRSRTWTPSAGSQSITDGLFNLSTGKPGSGNNLNVPPVPSYQAVHDYVFSYSGGEGYFGHFSAYAFDVYHKNNFWDSVFTEIIDTGTYVDVQQWALVVSPSDCCSVSVATRDYSERVPSTSNKLVFSARNNGTTELIPIVGVAPGDPVTFTLDWTYMWQEPSLGGGSYTPGGSVTSITESAPQINTWSLSLDAEGGVPSASYASLFSVDISDPTYNGTITFYESDGGKYKGSEGYNSGGISNGLFVGWF